jgi:Family of unknown function (DUF6163)
MKHPERPQMLEPVHADQPEAEGKPWSYWLFVFLRAMAALSLIKGLYHWAVICGLNAPEHSGFDSHDMPYQIATVFFAIIDPVAGVGLWLTAPWGPVLWLTSVISMAAVEVLFPQIFGGGVLVVLLELVVLGGYLWLTMMTSREQAAAQQP